MTEAEHKTAKYDVFEVALQGPADGNPYHDVSLAATFSLGTRAVRTTGFYDGNGTYRIRFMPDAAGIWSWTTHSTAAGLNGQSGRFTCTKARSGVHGPVRVRNQFHFGYDDGTPYFPFGTTCYAWTHQPLAEQALTLTSLAKAGFNKLRMCVFPKDYPFNTNEPLHDIFARGPAGNCDFDQPNYTAFQHFDRQIRALMEMGVEADVILFHPYDRWGYSGMTPEQDCRYLAYVVARLSAYRNVWWSLANEYDFLLNTKPLALWERFFRVIQEHDPNQHLKSIHNGDVRMNYDHSKSWVDHVCIQNWDVKRTQEWRDQYGKPVVNDEPEYEGNIIHAWGNISARELVHRYWITLVRGGYAGHGETYMDLEEKLWWAKGGVLKGEAWPRIKFLKALIEADVHHGLTPFASVHEWPWSRVSGASDGPGPDGVRYIYLGEHQPAIWAMGLPQEPGRYQVDVIDTWAMTVERVEPVPPPLNHPVRNGEVIRPATPDAIFAVPLPSRSHLAIRVKPLP